MYGGRFKAGLLAVACALGVTISAIGIISGHGVRTTGIVSGAYNGRSTALERFGFLGVALPEFLTGSAVVTNLRQSA